MVKIDPHDRIHLTGPEEWTQVAAPKRSESAENGGWARVYAVPTPNRPMWST